MIQPMRHVLMFSLSFAMFCSIDSMPLDPFCLACKQPVVTVVAFLQELHHIESLCPRAGHSGAASRSPDAVGLAAGKFWAPHGEGEELLCSAVRIQALTFAFPEFQALTALTRFHQRGPFCCLADGILVAQPPTTKAWF